MKSNLVKIVWFMVYCRTESENYFSIFCISFKSNIDFQNIVLFLVLLVWFLNKMIIYDTSSLCKIENWSMFLGNAMAILNQGNMCNSFYYSTVHLIICLLWSTIMNLFFVLANQIKTLFEIFVDLIVWIFTKSAVGQWQLLYTCTCVY